MIPIIQARGVFTNMMLAAYKERIPVSGFLRSFFSSMTSDTKYVSIEVQRGTEKIAVDVLRGVAGKRNTFSKSSEKFFQPPMYNENFDATQLDRYDLVFGQNANISPATIGYLSSDVADKYIQIRDKIERAKELQAAQVFETGVVVTNQGDNIDFKRKSTSLVDLKANPWSTASTDVEAQLVGAAEFIRKTGKNGNPVFNLIISGTAWIALKKTNYFKDNAEYRQVKLIDINLPQAEAFGAAYHGQITAGAYIFNVWTYDEGYEDANGTWTRYTNEKKMVIIPTMGAKFVFSHAGIPAIIRDMKNVEFPEYIKNIAGEYWMNNFIDPQAKSHTFELLSAPLAVPVTVDMIYTAQILA